MHLLCANAYTHTHIYIYIHVVWNRFWSQVKREVEDDRLTGILNSTQNVRSCNLFLITYSSSPPYDITQRDHKISYLFANCLQSFQMTYDGIQDQRFSQGRSFIYFGVAGLWQWTVCHFLQKMETVCSSDCLYIHTLLHEIITQITM